MSRIEDQLRQQDLVGAFINLRDISPGREGREGDSYQKTTHGCDAVDAVEADCICIYEVEPSIMNELTSITWWLSQQIIRRASSQEKVDGWVNHGRSRSRGKDSEAEERYGAICGPVRR
jgi:hypothetical protein